MIEKKPAMANKKVVEETKKGIPLDLEYFTTTPRDKEYFTTFRKSELYAQLSELQKQAIGKIEEYWQNKISNFKNWKRSRHFGYRKETISARVDEKVFSLIRKENRNQIIQNFIRYLLRDNNFRFEFEEKRHEQSKKDLNTIMSDVGLVRDTEDLTAFMKTLQRFYPYVVSGELYTVEKELFSFYCYYLTPYSISYNLRCGLLFNYQIENQESIFDKGEVRKILEKMLEERNQDERE